jgi:invasion protein IalB
MKVEWWDSGVDFYVVTPFYVVSNLYKRKSGTIIAPMPIALVKGTLAQIGKKYIWQVSFIDCSLSFSLILMVLFISFHLLFHNYRVTVIGSMDSFRTWDTYIGVLWRETDR